MNRSLKNAPLETRARVKSINLNAGVHGRVGLPHRVTDAKTIRPGQDFSCQPFCNPCTCDMCSRLNRMRCLENPKKAWR